MKLLMENWRSYVAETEKSSIYGKMYLFEDENIREVSFYEHFNQLNENGDDVERFLENWEQSVDHMLEHLNEQTGVSAIDDAVLLASTQAWLTLGRFKDKAVAPVLNVIKKLKNYQQQNPKSAKAIKVTVTGLAAAAAAAGVFAIVTGGGDAGAVQELAQAISAVDPGVGQDVAEVAQNFTPEAAVELISNQEQTVSQVTDALTQFGDQGLQQVAQATEEYESTFGDMMSDLQAEKSTDNDWFDGPIGAEAPTGGIDWQSMNPGIDPEAYDKYGPYGDSFVDPNNEFDLAQLEKTAQQWTEFKEMAETFESGGNLEDLDMSRKDFKKWASDAVNAPNRPDSNFKRRILGADDAGLGGIPTNYIKWLRKLMRASLKT